MSRHPGARRGLDTPTAETGEDDHATRRGGGPARAGPLSSAGLGLRVRIRAPHGAFRGTACHPGRTATLQGTGQVQASPLGGWEAAEVARLTRGHQGGVQLDGHFVRRVCCQSDNSS